MPANQHQHVVGTGIFRCQAADLDRFPLAERRDYFGSHAPSRERKLDFVLQVVVPAESLFFWPIRIDDNFRKLFDGGVMLWWFAADWAVARRKFKERGIIPVGLFDIQIRKIEAALPDINALFRSHKEYTLPSTGIYTPPDRIWESMLDTLVGPASKHRFHARRR
jgi:hypothetical protein